MSEPASPLTPLEKEFGQFIEEFSGESDRAAVVLGAAKLDQLLYQILAKLLLPTPGNQDELLEGDGALSTFSARINLCYRLNLFDAGLCRALHLVRRIRNAFAHETSSRTLEAGPHSDRIRELVAPLKGLSRFTRMQELFFKGKSGAAVDFRTALSVALLRLHGALERTKPLSGPAETPFVPTNWRPGMAPETSTAPGQ